MQDIEYFDIHSHINFPQYDTDREAVITSLKEKKIATVTIGTDLKTSKEAVELANTHENLYATIGVHPDDGAVGTFNEADFVPLVVNPKVVAIGECGLDYASLPENPADANALKQKQKIDFEKQIDFAVAYNKPLMIHCRSGKGTDTNAYTDTINILASKKDEHGEKLRANFHFFTEPIETADKILALGFTVSFTGVITFVKQYEALVAHVPLEKMMSETDAPFVAPVPHRGKRNSPEYVISIVEKIAEIKKLPLEEVKKAFVANGKAFFGI